MCGLTMRVSCLESKPGISVFLSQWFLKAHLNGLIICVFFWLSFYFLFLPFFLSFFLNGLGGAPDSSLKAQEVISDRHSCQLRCEADPLWVSKVDNICGLALILRVGLTSSQPSTLPNYQET